MKIIDTYSTLLTAYDGENFSFERWKRYIDSELPELYPVVVEDAKQALADGGGIDEGGYSAVLNGVVKNREKLEEAHKSFVRATENLEKAIYERFGKSLDVTVVFYIGLCNGAGWVTEYRGRTAILLGVEKIVELGWCGFGDMCGLIYHELGHVYQKQYGVLERKFDKNSDSFLWQLFTEGVAMCFEQEIVGDGGFYHQDKGGWKEWCERNFEKIRADFAADLPSMTRANQRYFGDWADYRGKGDVGYYLGCRFVRYILGSCAFDEVIGFDIGRVREMFEGFCADRTYD